MECSQMKNCHSLKRQPKSVRERKENLRECETNKKNQRRTKYVKTEMCGKRWLIETTLFESAAVMCAPCLTLCFLEHSTTIFSVANLTALAWRGGVDCCSVFNGFLSFSVCCCCCSCLAAAAFFSFFDFCFLDFDVAVGAVSRVSAAMAATGAELASATSFGLVKFFFLLFFSFFWLFWVGCIGFFSSTCGSTAIVCGSAISFLLFFWDFFCVSVGWLLLFSDLSTSIVSFVTSELWEGSLWDNNFSIFNIY